MKKFSCRRAFLALGVVALSLMATAPTARADFTIAALIAGTYSGPTLTGHDVLVTNGVSVIDFSNFGNYTGDSSGGATAPTAADVTVHGAIVMGNSGLLFNSSLWSVSSGQSVDSAISYTVTVKSGPSITDLHLSATGGRTGTGQWTIDDTFVGSPGTVLPSPGHGGPLANDSLSVFNFGPAPADHQFSDVLYLAPPGVNTIQVVKDINLQGYTSGHAQISGVFQLYSVPEPASFALVALGMLSTGIVAYRRRKTTPVA